MTYLTMFNVNSIVEVCSTVYDSKKKVVVEAMKADRNESWKRRGGRFEVFRPKHENPEPSEWYVALYTLLRPAVLLGLNNGGQPEAARSGGRANSFRMLANIFHRRPPEPEEPERPEEGWVL